MRLKRNAAAAEDRRILVPILDDDGNLADPTTDLTGCVFVCQASADFVAPAGTLTNARKPIVVPDFTFTIDNTTEIATAAAHGRSTGDGPFIATTTGTLPGTLPSTATLYIIAIDANTFYFASTRANALAGTNLTVSSNGTGTHTLADTADTQALIAGRWIYEATQAELDFDGAFFGLLVTGSGLSDTHIEADMVTADGGAIVEGSATEHDILRLIASVLAGKVLDFSSPTLAFKSLDGSKTRLTGTRDATGRLTNVLGDLT